MARAPLRDCLIAALALMAASEPSPARVVCVENATIGELQQALAAGDATAAGLVRAYLARIEAYDRAGPHLNSVREVNPDALAIAARSMRGSRRRAGRSPASRSWSRTTSPPATRSTPPPARWRWRRRGPKRDATVVKWLRQAGAVILGKANLTEFANILAIDMPSGYSSLGGQVQEPLRAGARRQGRADRAARRVELGLGGRGRGRAGAAAIGTETSGSLLSPASQNGLVTVKPTVGLISRAGIIPIAHSQDTAGPLTRTVRDAAILLNVLAAARPARPGDRASCSARPTTPSLLDTDGLKGARIGVPSDPADPGNDVYYGRCRRAPPR